MSNLSVINGKLGGFLKAERTPNISPKTKEEIVSSTIYIGRKNNYYQLLESPLANPFRIDKDGSRGEVIGKYRRWLWDNIKQGLSGVSNDVFQELMRIAKLVKEGEKVTLACYCKPKECHGDVLVKAINWLITENVV